MSLKPNNQTEKVLPPPCHSPAHLHQFLLEREVEIKSRWHGRNSNPPVIYIVLS